MCPRRLKNLWLFAVSLFFYAFGEPIYVLLMLFASFFGYICGRAICRWRAWRRPILVTAVVFYIGLLAFFKYYSLICSILPLPPLDIPLPIGISFYTFQALSYVIDVYRGQVEAESSFVTFGAYVSLFPQLIAGPIVRYTDVSAELSERRHSISDVSEGIGRFCAGLAKKAILANSAGALSETVMKESSLMSFGLWLVLFAFQIYYDFSGYSDMAIGLGRIFGFKFPENFNYPYISENITEFWRRWHMTLSFWFREYVYIPLGGNRRGAWRRIFNLFVVWSLTGLWHGAQVNFLLWGIYFFVILAFEKSFVLKLISGLPRLVRHCYAICLILAGWLIFAADRFDMPYIFELISGPVFDGRTAYILLRNIPFLAIMLLGVTPIPKRLYESARHLSPCSAAVARNALSLVGLVLSTAYITASGYNPFLYFRF